MAQGTHPLRDRAGIIAPFALAGDDQNQKHQQEQAAGGRTPPDPNSNRSCLAKMAVDRDLERYSDPDRHRIRFADNNPDTDDHGNRSNPVLARQAPAVKKPRGNNDWGRSCST